MYIYEFKRYHPRKPYVFVQQVYNWINEGKLDIKAQEMCYKRSKRKKKNTTGMMKHTKWNMENKTVLPIRLRPSYIEEREEVGHLEIRFHCRQTKRTRAIISIVDRCSRVV